MTPLQETNADASETGEAGAATAGADDDPRLRSGVPEGVRTDSEEFIRLTGVVRRKLRAAPPPAEHAPGASSFYHAGMAEVDPAAGPLALEAASAGGEAPETAKLLEAFARQRMEGGSRLQEAEQLLQALERQPREGMEPTDREDSAPAEAIGHLLAPEHTAAAPLRPRRSVMNVVRFLCVLTAFALASWIVLHYLLLLMTTPVQPQEPEAVPPFSVERPLEGREEATQPEPLVEPVTPEPDAETSAPEMAAPPEVESFEAPSEAEAPAEGSQPVPLLPEEVSPEATVQQEIQWLEPLFPQPPQVTPPLREPISGGDADGVLPR